MSDEAVALWATGIALAAALLHLGLRRRIDLGGLVVALVTTTWLLVPALPGLAEAGLALAVCVAAVAWNAGAARGVGRPDLTGLTLAVAAIAAVAVHQLPLLDGVSADVVRYAAVGPVVLVGALTVLFARERRGLAGQRVWHHREVPIASRHPEVDP